MMTRIDPTRVRTIWITFSAILLIALIAAWGGGPNSAIGQQGPNPFVQPTDQDLIFPRVRIVEFDGDVARLDTATGAVHTFIGDLSRPNVRGHWRLFVLPVQNATSGFLQTQRVGGGTFLIDAITGETWVLRRRGLRGSWDSVPVVG